MNPPFSLPLGFIREDVRKMHAYTVASSRGLIKLDAMENPFSLPPALQQALGARLGRVAINRYPGDRVQDLHSAVRGHAGVPDDWGVMLGNGSDELISLLATACARPGAKVLAPLPGFVMYAMSAQVQGLSFVGVDLTADFELDETAMRAAIAREKPAITYLAYPNNPTANLWDADTIGRIIADCATYGGLVVMDEAYQPFSARTWLHDMTAHPQQHTNVLLMRTLSKFGLAGVRLGYLSGPQALIGEIDKLRPPYNVSALNAECALFALEHADTFLLQAQLIRQEREALAQGISTLPGYRVYPSEANMLLVRTPDARAIFDRLKAAGILVKNVAPMHPLLHNCLRLTVGQPQDNQRLMDALASISLG